MKDVAKWGNVDFDSYRELHNTADSSGLCYVRQRNESPTSSFYSVKLTTLQSAWILRGLYCEFVSALHEDGRDSTDIVSWLRYMIKNGREQLTYSLHDDAGDSHGFFAVEYDVPKAARVVVDALHDVIGPWE